MENGVRHADEDEVEKSCGVRAPGLLIPFQCEGADGVRGPIVAPDGEPFWRARLDNQNAVNPPRRYTQRAGSGVHTFLPIGWSDGQGDGRLVLAESEFKALAVNDRHQAFYVPAVGLTGFYGFQQGAKEMNNDNPILTPELAYAIAHLKPQRLDFIGDNDTALNFEFSRAVIRLKGMLPDVALCLPRIPLDKPKGIDDVREEMRGKYESFFRRMVEDAVEVPASMEAADLALLLLRRELSVLRKLREREPINVLRRLANLAAHGGKLFANEVINIAKTDFGVPKGEFAKVMVDNRREAFAGESASPENRIARAVNAFAYDGENYWKQDEADLS